MTFSVLVFYTRRPDVTPERFQTYMEETHVPLFKKVLGPHYPLSYNMRYVVRVSSGAGDRLGATTSAKGRADPDAPVVLVGSTKDVEWDALGEMVFRDELHVQQAFAMMNSPAGEQVQDDEGEFTVPDKLRLLLMGETRYH
ncbi:hypothetical protein BDW02DRAFT_567529 [Decorospora gaudefroyi]|uniref:EthD domain-containing protein n=1 Tax=Decorospora gaudefroyi TaxID=184978 RepID=A0A6A5KJ66_9PLEO|nr:hypothetical protein BDW02DRAFT_567529 [Decorospora gaudefroyi]